MVNSVNVSLYDGVPPESENAVRVIRGGPLYPPAKVRAALECKGAIAWTDDAGENMQDLGFDIEDVVTLIDLALTCGRFLNSQWCKQKKGGPWAACDGYKVGRLEWNENAYKELKSEYYLKFAVAKSGALVLTTSCHLS